SSGGAGGGTARRVGGGSPAWGSGRAVAGQQPGLIEAIEPAASRLYVSEMLGGPSRLRIFDLAGKDLGAVDTDPVSTVTDLQRLDGDSLVFGWTSYREPLAYLRLDPKLAKPVRTALFRQPTVDF